MTLVNVGLIIGKDLEPLQFGPARRSLSGGNSAVLVVSEPDLNPVPIG
jgi:hypothetical protein